MSAFHGFSSYHVLIVYIQTQISISKPRVHVVFQTQIPISLVTLVISTLYKYTIKYRKERITYMKLCSLQDQRFREACMHFAKVYTVAGSGRLIQELSQSYVLQYPRRMP